MNSEPRLSSSSSTTFQRRSGELPGRRARRSSEARATGAEAGSPSSASSRLWFSLSSGWRRSRRRGRRGRAAPRRRRRCRWRSSSRTSRSGECSISKRGEAVTASRASTPAWAKSRARRLASGVGRSQARGSGRAGRSRACDERRDGDEDLPRRIALPDIGDDFGRVEQVVDGDEVEPAVELLEEEPLRGGGEQRTEEGAARPLRAPLLPAGLPPALGKQREIDHPRQDAPGGDPEIENAAGGEDAQPLASGSAGLGSAGDDQGEPGEAAQHDQKERESEGQSKPGAEQPRGHSRDGCSGVGGRRRHHP
jgi:hypothetical protein